MSALDTGLRCPACRGNGYFESIDGEMVVRSSCNWCGGDGGYRREPTLALTTMGDKAMSGSMKETAKVEYEVQGYYAPAHGWETVTTEETFAAAREQCRVYDREEPGYRHRIQRVERTERGGLPT